MTRRLAATASHPGLSVEVAMLSRLSNNPQAMAEQPLEAWGSGHASARSGLEDRLELRWEPEKMAAAVARTGRWKIEIMRRCDRQRFVVPPKRRIVERTIGWISRNRRLARDFERHGQIAAAFVRMGMIRIMLRRLATKPSA